ncbi:hypothetical protein PVL30_000030 [Lodderomyces elongisporus]|uniref:uncharacterized protein n=1 Tax=Lodderomyces elongisporus TaxID=36914 RepID=UPI0029212FB8|nr:uncharacterized protein PVL30_000030 [Lodderomyces elongisporus]WLF76329.1 hypothetical protein PVL30_000030 [Lodderomyces elongisporus]
MLGYAAANREKPLFAVHNTSATKTDKSPADEMVLSRYDMSKFSGPKSKDIEGFFHWLKKLIWYKHVNYIPDYLLRKDIISAAVQQGKTDEDVYVDLVGEVNKLKKSGCDPRSILITISIEVENYLTYNKIGDLPTIT